jgi:hypothetical protein
MSDPTGKMRTRRPDIPPRSDSQDCAASEVLPVQAEADPADAAILGPARRTPVRPVRGNDRAVLKVATQATARSGVRQNTPRECSSRITRCSGDGARG